MISPDSLSHEQKRFLSRQYRLDVDDKVRPRRGHRFAIMFSWVQPLIAAGLLWDGTPGSTAFEDKPAEFVAWCLLAFLFFGNAAVFLYSWRNAKPGGKEEA